ncbi:cryptochrome/photolyase family protein [Pararhizobium sp.]|uniref:cryptochrome/photolyase family protein n=1 Tax=Pararhizobium sp. TaxID=1977563 RepID=UPI00271F1BE9|nr:deoxyribodipyrimidine photo-lyase [Pararhizobium sp.]MDO9416969.1 deoxyribodipyrimidine photo-lyase [Pararhizobium sp.]
MPAATPSPADPVIVWFRKDLRLSDNHALSAAVSSGRPVLAVYIRDTDAPETGPLGAAQAWWLHHSLDALAKSIEALGNRLILRSGKAGDVLGDLINETSAGSVYWNRRYDPAGIAVDQPVKEALQADGIVAKSFAGQLLHEPTKTLTKMAKAPYKVYTPFWNALETSGEPDEPLARPETIPAPEKLPKSEALSSWHLLPTKPDWADTFFEVWTPGEEAALERLDAFIDESLKGYKVARDVPAESGTSLLSPHLALGEISPARIWHATRGLGRHVPTEDLVTFRKELVWREFSYHLLFHNPSLPAENLNRKFDAFPWLHNEALFSAWTKGMTGYPIVDAGMRQLWRHGYMHNRVRMIAASFMIKDLLIDWRRGEAWFRDTLVDADPASNSASWQWVAGSGADASPFFRVFNPVLQGEKFDADGAYVRTFIPELETLDAKYIHRPFEAPEDILKKAGITLGSTYPEPIVNHASARDRALAAYNTIKETA